MFVLARTIDLFFTLYTLMILARVLLSWFPQSFRNRWVRALCAVTDPYLNLFRRWIPPIGMLDLSPLVAFFALQILQWMIALLLHAI